MSVRTNGKRMPKRIRAAANSLLRMQELGVLLALLLLGGFLSLTTTTFLSEANLTQVARQASYYGIMAVGMVFVISMGEIDLSVGSMLTLTNITTGLALQAGAPVLVALLIGLVTGAVCGMVNGLLSVLLGIPTIIVTVGTLSVYRGLALILSQASPISRFSKEGLFFTVGGGDLFGLPTSVVVMLSAGLVGWIAFTRTVHGRRIAAIGTSPTVARLAGISLAHYKVGVMTLNGAIAAVAGLIALAFLQSADPTNGQGFELWVIASVIIGGTALSGGQGSVPGAILGALIIAVIRNGLVLLGASAYTGTAVTGAVIILAVAVDAFVKRRAQGRIGRSS